MLSFLISSDIRDLIRIDLNVMREWTRACAFNSLGSITNAIRTHTHKHILHIRMNETLAKCLVSQHNYTYHFIYPSNSQPKKNTESTRLHIASENQLRNHQMPLFKLIKSNSFDWIAHSVSLWVRIRVAGKKIEQSISNNAIHISLLFLGFNFNPILTAKMKSKFY